MLPMCRARCAAAQPETSSPGRQPILAKDVAGTAPPMLRSFRHDNRL